MNDDVTGVLQVSSSLDRSSASIYSLCVSASDGLHNSTVNVNISLYQPSEHNLVDFSQRFYVFDVPEDSELGVTVGRVEAFIAVIGHLSSSSSSLPVYSIVSRWARSVFSINETYGILTLSSAVDYETVSLRLCLRV